MLQQLVPHLENVDECYNEDKYTVKCVLLSYILFVQKHIMACRPVGKQRQRNRQLYKSRF
jgi:hypothetical protein